MEKDERQPKKTFLGNWDKLSFKLKQWLKIGIITTTMNTAPIQAAPTPTQDRNNDKTEITADKQQDTTDKQYTINIADLNPYNTTASKDRKFYFIVDSLLKGQSLGYFDNEVNSITLRNPQDRVCTPTIKYHELHHKDNFSYFIYENPQSLDQLSKIAALDEISGKLAEVIAIRQMYKDAQTDKQREEILASQGPEFKFYTEALKTGKINPNAYTQEEFDKEMQFIAQNTQKMWLNDFAAAYTKQITYFTIDYLKMHDFDDIQSNYANYTEARKHILTVGGFDFSPYMNDINILNENFRKADAMIKNNSSREKIESLLSSSKEDVLVIKTINDEPYNKSGQTFQPSEIQMLSAVENCASLIKETINNHDNDNNLKEKDIAKKIIKETMERQSFNPSALCDILTYIEANGIEKVKQALESEKATTASVAFETQKKNLLTINGVDYSKYLPKKITLDPHVKQVEDMIKKGSTMEELYTFITSAVYHNEISQTAVSADKISINCKKTKEPNYYHGKPIYRSHDEKNRVSPVQTEHIYDLSQTSDLLIKERAGRINLTQKLEETKKLVATKSDAVTPTTKEQSHMSSTSTLSSPPITYTNNSR